MLIKADIERFNRRYGEDVLDAFVFDDLNHAPLLTHAWIWIYNNERPHSTQGY